VAKQISVDALRVIEMAEEKEDTKFKTGNQVWKARSSHGRKPIFKNEDALWKAASEYFEYVEDNPFITYKGVLDKDNSIVQIPQYHPKPFTIGGLCVFLDISLALSLSSPSGVSSPLPT